MTISATSLGVRADHIFAADRRSLRRHTNRVFASLFILQWLAGIAAAVLTSPLTWSGSVSSLHLHVWAALVLGGLIAVPAALIAFFAADREETPFAVAVAQMLASGLLIHITGGRIETHFHIFGSLAFLAFYRDWRVLVPATVVIVADHTIRGVIWPESVYGVLAASPLRSVEHAGWILFEDLILVVSCVRGMREMRIVAFRQAETESRKTIVENEIAERTSELRHSEERFRSLSEASPLGIFETDAYGRCTYVNRRWSEIAGRPARHLHGATWIHAVHPEDRARIAADWLGTTPASDDYAAEFRMRTPTGDARWVSLHARGRRDRSGEIASFVGTLEDITDRKAVETSLAIALDRAEESTRLKSEFLATMSHELRTPMNGIFGMIDIALDSTEDADRTDALQRARTCAVDLLTLINDVLDLSRAQAGNLAIEHVAFDPRREVDAVLTLVTPIARTKHLELSAIVDRTVPAMITGDPTRFRQVLLNLAGNAAKFTDVGEVVLRVDCIATNGGDALQVRVCDSGIGIAADKLDVIFESFRQGDASMTRRYGGTGLGLSIAKRLVELMDGEIGVASELGRGSEFWFTLPFTAVDAPAAPKPLALSA